MYIYIYKYVEREIFPVGYSLSAIPYWPFPIDPFAVLQCAMLGCSERWVPVVCRHTEGLSAWGRVGLCL